jgi:hypothetical protein
MIISTNRKWLIIISFLMIGILSAIVYGTLRKSNSDKMFDSVSDVIQSADDGTEEFKEEIIDEIDDNRDS